ncbi:hypothetical protein WJ542_13975 [Paraburkholderia sp. B3]|uniref:hypothetical protein n=1 Tax=Paraburkholderia sp. B3 TaxID=3134791 RepID=UPI003982D4AA
MPAPLARRTEAIFADVEHRTETDFVTDLLAGSHGTPEQRSARHSGVARLAALGKLGADPTIAAEYAAATIIHSAPDQRCHILDLPMPGKITAAVALPQTISRVDAFGWVKD